jgi:hypothetical protein
LLIKFVGGRIGRGRGEGEREREGERGRGEGEERGGEREGEGGGRGREGEKSACLRALIFIAHHTICNLSGSTNLY